MPAGWIFPMIIAVLVIVALLAAINVSDLRAAVTARRRRSSTLEASRMGGMSSESGGSTSQAAR